MTVLAGAVLIINLVGLLAWLLRCHRTPADDALGRPAASSSLRQSYASVAHAVDEMSDEENDEQYLPRVDASGDRGDRGGDEAATGAGAFSPGAGVPTREPLPAVPMHAKPISILE